MFLKKSDVLAKIAATPRYLDTGMKVYCFDEYAMDRLGVPRTNGYFEGVVEEFDGDTCYVKMSNGDGAWAADNHTYGQKWINTISEMCSSTTLRVDLPPFAKAGDKVYLNENNFIVVNDELFLEYEEFHKLI